MSVRDILRESIANARELAAQGDLSVFAPLLQRLDDAETETEATLLMLDNDRGR